MHVIVCVCVRACVRAFVCVCVCVCVCTDSIDPCISVISEIERIASSKLFKTWLSWILVHGCCLLAGSTLDKVLNFSM